MPTREQLTRDAKSRGLTGREATAWVRYQLAKDNLSAAQEQRRAKAAAKKTQPARRPAAKKKAPTVPAKRSPFGMFGGR